MKGLAIIPARGGSKGVPGKNIRLLGGFPLIAYSIAAARLTSKVDRILISTDSSEIAKIGRQFGAEVPFLRPRRYARDAAPDIEFMMHALKWLEKHEQYLPDLVAHLRPTTPLRDPAVLDDAFSVILRHPEATSLRSAHPAPESPFKWFTADSEGYFRGLLSSRSNDALNAPRQSFPEVYIPDGYIDIIRPAYLRKTGLLYGLKIFGFVSPVCCEVDAPEDLDYLEFELRRKGNVLLDWLRREFRA